VVLGLLHSRHMNPSQPSASPRSSPPHSRQPSAAMQSSASSSSAPGPIDAHAVLAQLQQQMAAMHQQMQQQANQHQQQVAHLQQNAMAQAAVAAAAPAAAPRSLPKIAPALKFKGTMGGAVDVWHASMVQQFEYYVIDDDASKLRMGAANLEGDALQWYNSIPAADKAATWGEFVELLHKRFRPVSAVLIARQRLAKLRQGQHHSVTAYTNAFQTILTVINDMSPGDQVFQYANGLLPVLAGHVLEKAPATLADAIQLAASKEATLGFAGRAAAGPSHYRASASSSSSGSVPMDINHIAHGDAEHEENDSAPRFHEEPSVARESALLARLEAMEHRLAALTSKAPSSFSNKTGDRVPGLKSGDIDRLMKDGKCFRCKQKGHMKRDCPQAPKSSN
jgi:hypothetical protein